MQAFLLTDMKKGNYFGNAEVVMLKKASIDYHHQKPFTNILNHIKATKS